MIIFPHILTGVLVLMLGAARMQPKKHMLIITVLHTPGGGTRLLAQHVSMFSSLKVCGDPYPFALSVTDIGGRAHSPVPVPPPLT